MSRVRSILSPVCLLLLAAFTVQLLFDGAQISYALTPSSWLLSASVVLLFFLGCGASGVQTIVNAIAIGAMAIVVQSLAFWTVLAQDIGGGQAAFQTIYVICTAVGILMASLILGSNILNLIFGAGAYYTLLACLARMQFSSQNVPIFDNPLWLGVSGGSFFIAGAICWRQQRSAWQAGSG